MSNSFSEDDKKKIEDSLIEQGFILLKQGGIKAVNIDVITESCYIAKGTFYSFFSSKSDFIYRIMKRKREQTKEKLYEYLSENNKLSKLGLKAYLKWMCEENPNIFSYLNEQETRWLISKWPTEYLENEDNDETTSKWIISLLENPKENSNWQLFCNYLKLVSWALNSKDYLIYDAYEQTIDELIDNACECICK